MGFELCVWRATPGEDAETPGQLYPLLLSSYRKEKRRRRRRRRRKMGRAPCCEKMGLKKGPWTPEEDQILINYIHLYGHGNWRALPKQAGLLRCGKSCRLRWTNYLRPDIKRGNFTKEEEETIIELHEMLGNRWSAIAAKLPGRTDNEIKNVWHTHLKKRLTKNNHAASPPKRRSLPASHIGKKQKSRGSSSDSQAYRPASPQRYYSPSEDISSSSSSFAAATTSEDVTVKMDSPEAFPEMVMDQTFWSEVLSTTNSPTAAAAAATSEFPFSPLGIEEPVHVGGAYDTNISYDMDMEFWYNVFTRSGELHELPEI